MGKPVINFWHLSVPKLIESAQRIVNKMTGNVDFPTPSPALTTLQKDIDLLSSTYKAALRGDLDQKQLMRDARKALNSDFVTLIGYVQEVSAGDNTLILSTGMEVKRPGSAVGGLDAPGNRRARLGNEFGQIVFLYGGVKGRLFYQVEIMPNFGDAKGIWTAYTTTKTRFVFSDLQSGMEYAMRVRAMGNSGPGTLSEQLIQKAF